ncbi:Gag-Pol polyprotein [Gossypium australe]|uniref:Gag-Pol polyprotein n=1 Tax=Gossypium australe TaxID=47621 RepID=A0A5B6VN25_9ROSI|nr:Gag-Pol polyprotein [Gossypium australe]
MSVTDYEREFVRLSKYARECMSTEAVMCKRFKDGLNEDIHRACKAEELAKEKRIAENESQDLRKRQLNKSYQSSSKKSRDFATRSGKQFLESKGQTTSVASLGNVRPSRLECPQCGRRHSGECGANEKACFRCGSLDHFIRDCPEVGEKEKSQNVRSGSATRGRPQRNLGNEMGNKNPSREQAARVEGRAPTRTYAIHAHEEASSPDIITGIFSLYDARVIALIDPGSTHSYICMKLVSSMSMPVESTEFVIRVSNPLGKYVLVDKVCKGCPLMIRGHCFSVDLMLLLFDEFDDGLVSHSWCNCELWKEVIKLKNENGDFIRVESDKQDRSSLVISSLSTQRYLRKGYGAYLAFVLNTKEIDLKMELLPRLPPIREIEFGIELAPSTAPISIGPYRMAPTELKELKAQLQELTDKGFARSSFSP